MAFPQTAGAFWPFAVTNAEGTANPLLHDPSINLMVAPLSTEVADNTDGSPVTTPDGTALVTGVDFDPSLTPGTSDAADTIINSPSDSASNSSISTYTVQSGDSPNKIAEKFGVSVNTILWANNITDRSTIKEGTKLVILPVSGIQHTVRSGETLSSLAKKYGGNAADIAQFNGLSSDGALQVGSTIIIPGGEISTSGISGTSSKTSTHKTGSAVTLETPVKSTVEHSGGMNYSDASGNPYRGGGGAALAGFFTNPLPGAILTQGLHGWDAVDLGAHTGTPILAAANGTVILSRMGGWNGGYGNYVILDNGHGVETLYAHMSDTKAETGSSVSAGQLIGYVGSTGDATGPHLHFEVRGAQNPFSYCVEGTVCRI